LITSEIFEQLQTAHGLLSEVDYALGSIELDCLGEDELDAVMERLDKYQRLKRKFGGDIENVLATYEKLKSSHLSYENLQREIQQLEQKIAVDKKQLMTKAQDLHQRRQVAAKQLSKELTSAVH